MKITIYKKEKVERATCVTMIAPVQVAVNRGKKKKQRRITVDDTTYGYRWPCNVIVMGVRVIVKKFNVAWEFVGTFWSLVMWSSVDKRVLCVSPYLSSLSHFSFPYFSDSNFLPIHLFLFIHFSSLSLTWRRLCFSFSSFSFPAKPTLSLVIFLT